MTKKKRDQGTLIVKCKGCGRPVKWTGTYGDWCASCKPRL